MLFTHIYLLFISNANSQLLLVEDVLIKHLSIFLSIENYQSPGTVLARGALCMWWSLSETPFRSFILRERRPSLLQGWLRYFVCCQVLPLLQTHHRQSYYCFEWQMAQGLLPLQGEFVGVFIKMYSIQLQTKNKNIRI